MSSTASATPTRMRIPLMPPSEMKRNARAAVDSGLFHAETGVAALHGTQSGSLLKSGVSMTGVSPVPSALMT
jgi:hypothetical protein